MKPTVYLYNLQSEKGRQIELLCLGQGIACRHVAANEYGVRIGYIAEIEGFDATVKSEVTQPFVDEMMILKAFDQNLLETFLSQYKNAGIEVIPLKAALTPTNVHWSSIELHAELVQERDEFLKQRKNR